LAGVATVWRREWRDSFSNHRPAKASYGTIVERADKRSRAMMSVPKPKTSFVHVLWDVAEGQLAEPMRFARSAGGASKQWIAFNLP
jgi:hypothetical protein